LVLVNLEDINKLNVTSKKFFPNFKEKIGEKKDPNTPLTERRPWTALSGSLQQPTNIVHYLFF
jgi:hypothetical protein